jgi:TetR/AcrR family tetracycline transcriptional repressor
LLDVERIVDSAVRLLDEVGTEGLSLRRLAADLGVAAASVYWHVPNKQALLDVVLDRLLGEVRDEVTLDPQATWRAQLAEICRGLRRVVLRHPAMAALLGQRLPVGPNGLALLEVTMAVLGRAGFVGARLALAHGAVIGYASGAVVLPARKPGSAGTTDWPADEQVGALGRLLSHAPRAQYPALFEMADELAKLSDEEQFEYGLQRLLDGLEQDLRGSAAPRRRF